MKPYKVTNTYVFIVYQFPCVDNRMEGRVLGVYINYLEAIGKYLKLVKSDKNIEVTILKKPLHGKSRHHTSLAFKNSVYINVKE